MTWSGLLYLFILTCFVLHLDFILLSTSTTLARWTGTDTQLWSLHRSWWFTGLTSKSGIHSGPIWRYRRQPPSPGPPVSSLWTKVCVLRHCTVSSVGERRHTSLWDGVRVEENGEKERVGGSSEEWKKEGELRKERSPLNVVRGGWDGLLSFRSLWKLFWL